MFSWKAQIENGKYNLQIETDNREDFKKVEDLCGQIMDNNHPPIKFNQQMHQPITNVNVIKDTGIPDCCKHCSSYPSNGGSGICHCTLPYMTTTARPSYDLSTNYTDAVVAHTDTGLTTHNKEDN